MIKIDNWSTTDTIGPYDAPELSRLRLHGMVFGHPRFPDGKEVRTSSIQNVNGRVIKTRNSIYKLGRIDPGFRKFLKIERPKWDWRKPITIIEHGRKGR